MTFWRSSGAQLLDRGGHGRLVLTEDFLRAYLLRPELAPVEESCDVERALHASLCEQPMQPITPVMLLRVADPDSRENYEVYLRFREHLRAHDSIESAYVSLFGSDRVPFPPLFVDQLAHVILRNVLDDCTDPYRLRAAECLFRSQKVTLSDGRILAADEEVVEMHARSGGMGSLGRLLVEAAAPMRSIELDVMGEDNAASYLERSDRFDMVLDLAFTRPGLDALCRVMEAWIAHFHALRTAIQPVQQIRDQRWSWHVGLDAEATAILDTLWKGETLPDSRRERLLSLFRMEVADQSLLVPSLAGKPIYLAMAMDGEGRLRMKPQNLLVNLPLAETG